MSTQVSDPYQIMAPYPGICLPHCTKMSELEDLTCAQPVRPRGKERSYLLSGQELYEEIRRGHSPLKMDSDGKCEHQLGDVAR
jgi:hypothetical protein